jgi:hypothetical protein
VAKSTIKLSNHLPNIKGKVNSAALEWLKEAAGELESETKRNTTADTGQLKNSWVYQVNRGKGEAYVGSPLENAVWNEYGTGEHAAEGNGRKTPWYVPVEAVTGTKKPSFQGQVVVVHGKNGKAYYKTDGKDPQMTLHNAWDTVMPKAEKGLQSKLKKIK